jgi:hypothetical protein
MLSRRHLRADAADDPAASLRLANFAPDWLAPLGPADARRSSGIKPLAAGAAASGDQVIRESCLTMIILVRLLQLKLLAFKPLDIAEFGRTFLKIIWRLRKLSFEGSLSVLVGRQGAMNPVGRIRCNMQGQINGGKDLLVC